MLQGRHVLDQERIEIWPGYRTSLRRHEHGPLVCCDLINKVVRLDNAYVELKKLMRYENQFTINDIKFKNESNSLKVFIATTGLMSPGR